MTIDYKALAKKAAETVDHTETTAGGDFEYPLIPAGKTLGRLIEYIELGVQPQGEYKGVAKPDADSAFLVFELLGKKNIREIEVDGKTIKVADRHREPITIKLGEKAKFKKIFNALRYGRDDITHI